MTTLGGLIHVSGADPDLWVDIAQMRPPVNNPAANPVPFVAQQAAPGPASSSNKRKASVSRPQASMSPEKRTRVDVHGAAVHHHPSNAPYRAPTPTNHPIAQQHSPSPCPQPALSAAPAPAIKDAIETGIGAVLQMAEEESAAHGTVYGFELATGPTDFGVDDWDFFERLQQAAVDTAAANLGPASTAQDGAAEGIAAITSIIFKEVPRGTILSKPLRAGSCSNMGFSAMRKKMQAVKDEARRRADQELREKMMIS